MKKQNLSLSISILALIISMISLMSSCNKSSNILDEPIAKIDTTGHPAKIKAGQVGNTPLTDSLIKKWDAEHAPKNTMQSMAAVATPIIYTCTTIKAPESREFPMDNGSFVDNVLARDWFYNKYGQPEILSTIDKSPEELDVYVLANTNLDFPVSKDSVMIHSNGSLGIYYLTFYHQMAIRTTYRRK